jgi:putative flippase GtrA
VTSSVGWFLATGGAAAATHMGVFATLQHLWPGLWPELANAMGFALAFAVSYVGHRHLSFPDAGTTAVQSFTRFAATALAGQLCNELVFSALLRWAHWPALLALLSGMVLAAGQTYVLGRFWAFRR